MNWRIHPIYEGCVYWRCLSLNRVGFTDQWWSAALQLVTPQWDIRNPSFRLGSLLTTLYSTRLWFAPHHTVHLQYITTSNLYNACWWRYLHRKQRIWLHWVANLDCNNAMITMQVHHRIVHELPWAETVDQRNTPINIICGMGLVTLLHSSTFQVLHMFITILHSTWHTTVHNQPPVHDKNFHVVCHCGKDMTSTKVVMVGLKCSTLSCSQDNGCHLQVHWECLQNCWETIQSMEQHLPAQLIQLDLHPLNLGDPLLVSERKVSSWQRNCRNVMLQGFWTCPHCQRFPTKIMTQIMTAMIVWTWAVPRGNRQIV